MVKRTENCTMDKDFVRDQNPTPIYFAFREEQLPEYIKEATSITPEDLSGLHESAFADRVNKLHPIHNKVAALLSGVYLTGHSENKGPVWDTVKKACEYYGVEKDLDKIESLFNRETSKSASTIDTSEDYAVQVQWSDTEVGSYYPIKSATEVAESAVNLDKDYFEGRMPHEVFQTAAVNIMKAASEKGVSSLAIPLPVQNAGEVRFPDLDFAELMLGTRKEAGVPEEGITIYKKALDIAKEAGTDEAASQAVSLWRDLDEQHDINYHTKIAGNIFPLLKSVFIEVYVRRKLKKQQTNTLCLIK